MGRYQVASNCSVRYAERTWPPGSLLPEDYPSKLGPRTRKAHLEGGWATPVGDHSTVDRTTIPTIKTEEDGSINSVDLNSVWNLNPAVMETKTLDQLNVLIHERDTALDPFEDKAEAVYWLSRDYAG